MEWTKLLNDKRLIDIDCEDIPFARTEYQRDFDRVLFSAAFRRLQDKAQVFPLASSDYVRTRLTHSLEVSCVGKALGTRVGHHVINQYNLKENYHPSEFGAIVSAACLAHDIGNPPFGHEGEIAIQEWFKSTENGQSVLERIEDKKRNDFLSFEGNAQGFRQLTRLQSRGHDINGKGGIKLTSATLAAFVKYPRFSFGSKEDYELSNVCGKKFGIFYDDADAFNCVADIVGLEELTNGEYCQWARHPLTYLVEAADDICYRIIDLEDGCKMKCIPHQRTCELFEGLIGSKEMPNADEFRTSREHIEHLRGLAIRKLTQDVIAVFIENEKAILKGEFDNELISLVDSSQAIKEIEKESKKNIYGSRMVIEVEAAGYEILGGLLDIFVPAVHECAEEKEGSSKKCRKIIELMPPHCLLKESIDDEYYVRTLKAVDFISGMTDTYALNLYRKIKGISLPEN